MIDMGKHKFLQIFILHILALIIVACEPTSTAIVPAKTTTTTTPAVETQTHTYSITSTPVPMKTFNSTVSVTATVDWDKMADGNKEVVEQLNDISGCRLPCFWGISPGKTRWGQIELLLSDVKAKISFTQQKSDKQRVEIFIPVLRRDSTINLLYLNISLDSRGTVEQIQYLEYHANSPVEIHSFLVENGEPDEIWIHSLASNQGGPPPFDVWLFYWEEGITAKFSRSEESAKYGFDGLIHACIEGGPILYLWSDQVSSLAELDKLFSAGFNMSDYMGFDASHYRLLPVEQAIGLSLDEFYNKYKDSTEPPCFVTEPGLWPEP